MCSTQSLTNLLTKEYSLNLRKQINWISKSVFQIACWFTSQSNVLHYNFFFGMHSTHIGVTYNKRGVVNDLRKIINFSYIIDHQPKDANFLYCEAYCQIIIIILIAYDL